MEKLKCILCGSGKVTFFDDYKFNVKTDEKFFGKLKIYQCNNCDLGFCDPMPKSESLKDYYETIYRAEGRPHETNLKNIDVNIYNYKNLNYFQYLTTFIDFSKIEKIFDFGSGAGDIGFLLKKKFSHLKLFSSEKDIFCKKILNKRGFQNYKEIENINEKFDLIISTHSLEHMTDFSIIEFFKKISNKDCKIFFEVPNCDLSYYHKRPYDSPHLIFFSKKNFFIFKEKFNLDIIDLNYSSYSIQKSFKYMEESKKKYQDWPAQNHILKKIKNIIKFLLPKTILDFREYLLEKKIDKLDYFKLNKKDSWCLRGLFKIN
jgi:hypothetical protein